MNEFEDTEFDDGEGSEEECFPLEKVLTVSLEEYTKYLESVGKSIRNYDLVGVHSSSVYSLSDEAEMESNEFLLAFADNIPETAEVVIAFNDTLSGAHESKTYEPDNHKSVFAYRASGIALIPKQRKRLNPEITEEDKKNQG